MKNRYFILTMALGLMLSGCNAVSTDPDSARSEATTAPSPAQSEAEDAPVFVESRNEHEETNPEDPSGRCIFKSERMKKELDDASKEKYPEFAKAWGDYVDLKNEYETSLTNEYIERALQRSNESFDAPDLPFCFDSGYSINWCDSQFVSAVYHSGGFGGGAHPWDDWESKTFDVMTGEEVLLSRFIPDKEALFTYLKDYFTKDAEYSFYDEWEDALSETVENSYKDIDKVKNSEEYIPVLNWALCTDGIEINFDHYTIAPRVEGDISVVIPYTENIVDKDAVFPDKAEDN